MRNVCIQLFWHHPDWVAVLHGASLSDLLAAALWLVEFSLWYRVIKFYHKFDINNLNINNHKLTACLSFKVIVENLKCPYGENEWSFLLLECDFCTTSKIKTDLLWARRLLFKVYALLKNAEKSPPIREAKPAITPNNSLATTHYHEALRINLRYIAK